MRSPKLGGGPYWRLPNIGELRSLDESNIKESLKINGEYWSREPNDMRDSHALLYNFDGKDMRTFRSIFLGESNNPKSTYYRVICVNGP